jgi:CheY-like chemotaxis protein
MERQQYPARSVLFVEDDPALRETVTEILEEEGYQVLSVPNGAEGLRLLETGSRPGLILLDLMMPTMNGWEFYNQIHQHPQHASIPVVVLSAVAEFQRRRGKLDVAEILSKPIDISSLLAAVERAYTNAERSSS